MSSWSNKPPPDDNVPPLRIIRTPPSRPFRSYILSAEVTGALTHFANNRTIKCPQNECSICDAGRLPRWYGYYAIYNPTSGARALFEIPRGAYITFDDYIVKYKTLRGAQFSASRQPDRPNGQVVVDLNPPDHEPVDFPPDPDVFRTLCQIWGLDWKTEIKKRSDAAREEAEKPAPSLPKQPAPHLHPGTTITDPDAREPRSIIHSFLGRGPK